MIYLKDTYVAVNNILGIPLLKPIDVFEGLTPDEVRQKRLDITYRKVREICRRNPIPCIGLSTSVRLNPEDVLLRNLTNKERIGTNTGCLDVYLYDII